MTEPDGMYGEELRHALSAVADLVVPDGDGLKKIRQRTRHRPPAISWLIAYGTFLPRALINSVRVPGSELILMAKGQSTVFKRVWAGRRKLTPKASSPQAWLRPAIAAAGALVLVVAVVVAVPRLRQTITPSALTNPGASTSAPSGNGGVGGGDTADVNQAKPGPGSSALITVPPVGGRAGKCPGTTGSSTTNRDETGGNPPVENSPAANSKAGTDEHCPSPSSPPHSSPGGSTGSSPPGSPGSSSSPPATGSTTPIPPSGGTPPTPTSSAVSNSPSPDASDSGGS